MQVNRFFTLDFCPDYSSPTISIKQLDSNSRFIEIEPRYQNDKIDIRSCTVKLFAQRSDKVTIVKECDINTSGNIFTEITDEITAVPGIIKCDVKLYESDSVISSAVFYINSISSVFRSNIIYAYRNRKLIRTIKVKYDNEPYVLGSSEKLVFGVKKPNANECLIRKELGEAEYNSEKGGYVLELSSGEMDICEGDYLYDVALSSGNELVKVISPTLFNVKGCVIEE